jgi:hypothetical protein
VPKGGASARKSPCGHNLAPARPSPHGGLIFQSIIRFGMGHKNGHDIYIWATISQQVFVLLKLLST